MKLLKFVFFIIFFEIYLVDAQVIINEVSSVNYDVYRDEDNERPDWIELYNKGDFAVNLEGWKIFDRDNLQGAWTFPSVELQSKERLLVQASGKNYSKSGKFVMEAAGEGIFKHSRNDSYRFQYTELSGDFEFSVQVHTLHNIGVFGSTGIIVREDLTNTNRFFGVLGQQEDRFVCEFLYREDTSFNYRYPVRIYSNTENLYPQLVLSVRRNGDSITSCINDIEGYCLESRTMYWDFPENVYVGIALASTNPDVPGKATYSNLKINGEPYDFGNLKFIEHDLKQPGSAYFSKELHTNFSISSGGETIYLWDKTGKLSDKVEVPPMYVDMSYSRIPDASNSWTYSLPPTPDKPNDNPKSKILKQPKFSLKPGLYSDVQATSIDIIDNNAKCYYTLDGTEPDENSPIYNGQFIFINESKVLKARIYLDGCIPSQIETATYLINENTVGMPVVSISSNPEYFFDEKLGLFNLPHNNFEYPLSFEYFNSDLKRELVNRVSVKTHGHGAALDEQVSLRFNAKSKYGLSELEYPFFEKSGLKSYDKVVIRNSGQDRFGAFIRDAFVSVLGESFEFVDGMAYKPVLVYLNADFWGLYNLRERFDEELLKGRYNIQTNSISMMEPVYRLMSGASSTYHELLSGLQIIETDSILPFLNRIVDIDNLIDYSVVSFWANNADWPQHNFKLWRSTELDNKWRWILMDFDMSLNFDYTCIYAADHFKFSMEKAKEIPELYHFPSILLNSFKSPEFRNRYLNRNCDLLNTKLKADFLIPMFDSLINNIVDAIPLQRQRWPRSIPNFDLHLDIMRTYFQLRPSYYREQLSEYFELSGISKIQLKSNLDSSCTFNVNSLETLPHDWEGYYFNDIPIVVTAERKHGFEFRHWLIADTLIVHGDTLNLTLSDSVSISAVFEAFIEPIPGMVVINEIMYKSADDIDSDDWVELYNPGDFDIDISGWLFKDDNNSRNFALPDNTILNSRDYLVLVESKKKFNKIYPEINNYKGEFDFGLGTEDMVRIFDRTGKIMDSVNYSNKAPWYPEADGLGPSLELISAFYDNSIASSWRVSSIDGGSPGRPNSATSVENNILDGKLKIYPNPAITYANIEFTLEYSGNIEIEIIDLLGNHVRTILSGYYDAGNYSSFWDGTNDRGTLVGRGMYILNIKTNKGIIRDKLIIE